MFIPLKTVFSEDFSNFEEFLLGVLIRAFKNEQSQESKNLFWSPLPQKLNFPDKIWFGGSRIFRRFMYAGVFSK